MEINSMLSFRGWKEWDEIMSNFTEESVRYFLCSSIQKNHVTVILIETLEKGVKVHPKIINLLYTGINMYGNNRYKFNALSIKLKIGMLKIFCECLKIICTLSQMTICQGEPKLRNFY